MFDKRNVVRSGSQSMGWVAKGGGEMLIKGM